MFNLNNYFINLAVKFGFKKGRERSGTAIKIKNSKNGIIRDNTMVGFETGIDVENSENLDVDNNKIT